MVLLALIATLIIDIFLASIVLYRGSHKRLNQYLFVFLVFVGLWIIGDALMLYAKTPEVARFGVVLFYIAPMVTTLFVLLFSESMPEGKKISRTKLLAYVIPAALFGGFIVINPDFLLKEIVINTDTRNLVVQNKGPYFIYGMYFNIYFGIAYVQLIRKIRKYRGNQRAQLWYSFLGITLSSALGVTTNITLPLQGVYTLVWLGPIFTLIYASMTAIAIIKHRLFEIRLIIARSVAYALLLISLGSLYALLLFLASGVFFDANQLTTGQQIMNVAIAIFVAFTFQPLKRFFERLTNKIFYRDRYDTQEVINKINKVITSNIELSTITQQSIDIICQYLKLEHGVFVVIDKNHIYEAAYYGKTDEVRLHVLQLQAIKKNVIIVDELAQSEIKTVLLSHQYEASLRLKTQEGVVGYILLGPKASGGMYGNYDIGLLEILNDELAVAVQNARSFEKIADFNITLQKRIEEATKRLATQNKKLKELDEAKDEFVSMASHQLRTPLTAIKGYISMLQDGDAGKLNKQQANFADLAYTSAQRMVFLISDMLNVSRINTGKLVIEKSAVNLETIVKDEADQLKRTAESRGVTLQVHPVEQKIPTLNLDEGKIRQVIMNFVDNAIYYAPNTTVEIFLQKIGDKIQFKVVDHGIGVPEKEKAHLFTKFFRAGNAQAARPDGTGLGLFMAKMVVELQGGEVLFESQEGKGSTFGFSFPEKLPKADVHLKPKVHELARR